MNLPEAPYQSEYLHYQHDKFWEIRVYNNCTTLIRCGRLGPNSQEDLSSIQTVQKSYNSNEDAVYTAQRLVEMKISKGYEYLNEENTLKRPPPAELFDEDIIMKQVKVDPVPVKSIQQQDFEIENTSIFKMPIECGVDIGDFNVEQKTKMLQKALELEVICSFEKGAVILKGHEENLKLVKAFIAQQQKEAAEKIGLPVSIQISPKLSRQGSELEKFGLGMGLICEVRKEKVIVLGEEEKVEAFKAYIVSKELETGQQPEVKKVVAPSPPPQKMVKEEQNDFIQQEINMTYRLNNQKGAIENKLKETGMFYEFKDGKLYLLGSKKSVSQMTDFLASLERINTNYQTDFVGSSYAAGTNSNYQTNFVGSPYGDSYSYSESSRSPTSNKYITTGYNTANTSNVQKKNETAVTLPKSPSSAQDTKTGSTKIKIKDIDPSIMDDIKKKAEELGIVATYSKNGLSIYTQKGQKINEEFTAYINARKAAKVQEEMKATSKRGLYPKYWDYDEKQPFARIRVKKGTDEYQEIADRFLETLNDDFQVSKIHRIQNTKVMSQHLDNIAKRMENRVHDPYQRRLLFQSAVDLCVDPLDPSYNALHVPEEGIYLAMNAEEFSKDAENGNGGYRMYLSDVFIGRQAQDEGQGMPAGYDSVKSGGYHVIYDVLQGYQLYEIDYRTIDDSNGDSDDDCYY